MYVVYVHLMFDVIREHVYAVNLSMLEDIIADSPVACRHLGSILKELTLPFSTIFASSPCCGIAMAKKVKKKEGKNKVSEGQSDKDEVEEAAGEPGSPENSDKDGATKKKKNKITKRLAAQAEVPVVLQDSESEPDSSGNWVNWKGIDVGGLKKDGAPAVQTVYIRKKCTSCGSGRNMYCGYRGYQWVRRSDSQSHRWTCIDGGRG